MEAFVRNVVKDRNFLSSFEELWKEVNKLGRTR
jgi:hypothetical protein